MTGCCPGTAADACGFRDARRGLAGAARDVDVAGCCHWLATRATLAGMPSDQTGPLAPRHADGNASRPTRVVALIGAPSHWSHRVATALETHGVSTIFVRLRGDAHPTTPTHGAGRAMDGIVVCPLEPRAPPHSAPASCASGGNCVLEFIAWTAAGSAMMATMAQVVAMCVTPAAVTVIPCALAWAGYTLAAASHGAAYNYYLACKARIARECLICATALDVRTIGTLDSAPSLAARVRSSPYAAVALDVDDCGGGGGGGGGGAPQYDSQQWFWYENGVAVAEWWECECVSDCNVT